MWEELHGVKIADPFRVLEDPEKKERKAFVEAQNKRTFALLEQIPYRDELRQRIKQLYNYEKYGCPFHRGGRIYFFHNSGLQAQSVLYREEVDGGRSVFIDPNLFADDGTASLRTLEFSKQGTFCGYSVSYSGSDWQTIKVKRATGEDSGDVIEWAKFTDISWSHDEAGFFYSRYPTPNISKDAAGTETSSSKNMMLMYHKVASPQAEDVLVWKDDSNPDHMFHGGVSDDGKYLIVTVSKGCDPENLVYVCNIEDTKGLHISVTVDWSAQYHYTFFFRTTLKAPKRRIVKFDLNHPEKGFEEVIPESEDVLESYSLIDTDKLFLVYLKDVKHVFKVYDLEGKLLPDYAPPLPVGSIIQSLNGDKDDKFFFYKYSSFTSPGVVMKYDVSTKSGYVYKKTELNGLDISELVVEQVFYESEDGTKIPVYLLSRGDARKNTPKPTLLYGYGGFNISITPYFSLSWVSFVMFFDGVVAVANIRGGGEYGQDWYDGGRLKKKQNCFTDFQYAAKYLIKSGITTSSHLAINGGSNGGLLVAACANQAPELFRAVVADVGVMDLLRFHKFTIGSAWTSDYGNPDVKEDFEYALKFV
ncbi:hypothetical protein HDU96_001096 [Phlyctochytrium bullatum]|nr:hypothetical protein HDU96_001096 [Phlyctochytrium bullatum]